jgi:hypothetical protein
MKNVKVDGPEEEPCVLTQQPQGGSNDLGPDFPEMPRPGEMSQRCNARRRVDYGCASVHSPASRPAAPGLDSIRKEKPVGNQQQRKTERSLLEEKRR